MSDGRWTWNYDRMRDWKTEGGGEPAFEDLWEKVSRIAVPAALWQGGAWSVMDDADVAEWMRRVPGSSHVVVEGAGHSIQGDRPLELTALIEDLLARPVAGAGLTSGTRAKLTHFASLGVDNYVNIDDSALEGGSVKPDSSNR